MSKLTFGYWKIRGLGQYLRHLLAYTNTDFQQIQYESQDKWFKQDKQNLGFDFPNLPYLIDGTFKLTESSAIAKYIIKRSGNRELLGKNLQDEGYVDNLMGVFNDVLKELRGLFGSKDIEVDKATALQKITPKLNYIKEFVGNRTFALGYVTLVDFFLSENLYYFEVFFPNEKKNYTFWWRIRTNLENLPGVKNYYKRADAIVQPFLPPHIPIHPKLHNVRLCYWKIRGTAQVPRLLLHFFGIRFQDCYYEDQDKWFNDDRLHLGLDFPNLPYLIDGDTNVTEPAAIQRYIIKKWGNADLLGKNRNDTAQIDSILSIFTEIAGAIKILFFHKDWQNAKGPVLEKYKAKLDQLNTFVGNKQFVFGYLTLADFVIAQESHYIQRIFPQEYKTWPFLHNIRVTFDKLPQTVDYYAKNRLKGPFFPEESPINVEN